MNPDPPVIRYRMTFAKTEHMRFTGHLDLNRTLERTFRRASLPISFTKGFTSRVKFNIASALPLGYTSDCEMSDVWLDEDIDPKTFILEFRAAAPPGIDLKSVQEIPIYDPSLQSRLRAAEYRVTLLDPVPDLGERLAALLAAETLPRMRRKKEYDLRPLIFHAAQIEPDTDGKARMELKLSSQEGATGRVPEVLSVMEIDPFAVRVKRTALIFEKE